MAAYPYDDDPGGLFIVFLLGLLGIAVIAGLLCLGAAHADVRHPEAPAIRSKISEGLCSAKHAYFAPPSGRVLFLCQLEDNPRLWGGWIIYVTQDNGSELLDPIHEATCFVSRKSYWDRMIVRDGYIPIVLYPEVLDHATDSLGIAW